MVALARPGVHALRCEHRIQLGGTTSKAPPFKNEGRGTQSSNSKAGPPALATGRVARPLHDFEFSGAPVFGV
jgi:hypothetical protein